MAHPEPAPIDVPDFIADGVTALLSEGFVQQRQYFDGGAFGVWQLELANEPLRVEVARDRFAWEVTAGWRTEGTPRLEWYNIEAWMECLRELDTLVSMTLEEQMEYVCQTWRSMKEALAPERLESTRACLSERQIVRSRAVLGDPNLGKDRY